VEEVCDAALSTVREGFIVQQSCLAIGHLSTWTSGSHEFQNFTDLHPETGKVRSLSVDCFHNLGSLFVFLLVTSQVCSSVECVYVSIIAVLRLLDATRAF
jgi:hypothetical protein